MSHARYWISGRATIALLTGFLAAPLAFLLDLSTRFALVEWSCRHGSVVLWIVFLLALALAATAFLAAWKSYRRLDAGTSTGDRDARPPQSTGHTLSDTLRTDEGGPHGRSRFLALAGIAGSTFFLALILASLVPSLLLDPCM